jgi:hypothetical protein
MNRLIALRGLHTFHDPEKYVQVADDLKLSFPLDLSREGGYLKASRRWLEVSVILKGVHAIISYPLRIDDKGYSDFEESYPDNIEELVKSLHHHRPRKPLPFPVDDEKSPVVFRRVRRVERASEEEDAEWTAPARPAAAINTMLKRMGYAPLDTPESNGLLAQLDELLLQFVASVRWLDGRPSWVYHNDSCSAYSSCMSGEPEEWFELYDSFYNDGRLRVLGIFRGGERIGRALVWTGENPADLYLDRVYAPGNRSTFDSDVVKAVKAFCQAEGIAKTCFNQTAEWFDLTMVNKLKLRVPHERGPDYFDRVPYVDSMYRFGNNGWLYNYAPNITGGYRIMQSTNGRFDDSDEDEGADNDDRTYVDNGPGSGDYHDSDDCCWVMRLDETWLRYYCTYSDHLDEYIPDTMSVETYENHLIWKDDAVELFDDEWADGNDPYLVCLSDGQWAVRCHHEVITMHDGTIVVDDGDLDWTTTVNGENALREDCVEVGGVWYLQGSEPEEVEDEETETVA